MQQMQQRGSVGECDGTYGQALDCSRNVGPVVDRRFSLHYHLCSTHRLAISSYAVCKKNKRASFPCAVFISNAHQFLPLPASLSAIAAAAELAGSSGTFPSFLPLSFPFRLIRKEENKFKYILTDARTTTTSTGQQHTISWLNGFSDGDGPSLSLVQRTTTNRTKVPEKPREQIGHFVPKMLLHKPF